MNSTVTENDSTVSVMNKNIVKKVTFDLKIENAFDVVVKKEEHEVEQVEKDNHQGILTINKLHSCSHETNAVIPNQKKGEHHVKYLFETRGRMQKNKVTEDKKDLKIKKAKEEIEEEERKRRTSKWILEENFSYEV